MVKEAHSTEQSLRVLAKASLIIFIGLVIGKLLSYLYRVIVARQFGPEVYGLFSLAVMIAGWFVAICSFGLSDGILRFVSVYRGQGDISKISSLFNKSLKLLAIGGIISGILLFFFAETISVYLFRDARLIVLLRIASISIPLSILLGPYLSLLLAFEKFGAHSFIVNIIQNVLSVGSLVLLLWIGFRDSSIILAYVLSVAGMLLFAYILSHAKIPKEVFSLNTVSRNDFREILDYSWPRMFQAIVSTIFIGIDSFMLGYFKGAYEVGLYNVAVPIAFLLGFAPDLFMRLFFPIITKNYAQKNFKLISDLSKQVGKWILILNVPLLMLILCFPGAIINILFGKEFLQASYSLQILGLAMFIYSITLVSMSLISMIGKSKIVLYNFIAVTICNFILNLFLVSRFGLNGAALAATLSYLMLGIIFFAQSNRYLRITPFKPEMARILFAGFISVFVLKLFSDFVQPTKVFELLISILFFGLFYLLSLYLFRCFDNYDKDIARAFIKKIFGKNQLPSGP